MNALFNCNRDKGTWLKLQCHPSKKKRNLIPNSLLHFSEQISKKGCLQTIRAQSQACKQNMTHF